MDEGDPPFAWHVREEAETFDPQGDRGEMGHQHQLPPFVSGVRIIGITETTIGNSRIALTVTAIAACTTVAPEPSVEIRMICAGPAQTNSVLASAHARLKCVSCASAPMPR